MKSMAPHFFSSLLGPRWHMGVRFEAYVFLLSEILYFFEIWCHSLPTAFVRKKVSHFEKLNNIFWKAVTYDMWLGWKCKKVYRISGTGVDKLQTTSPYITNADNENNLSAIHYCNLKSWNPKVWSPCSYYWRRKIGCQKFQGPLVVLRHNLHMYFYICYYYIHLKKKNRNQNQNFKKI